MSRGSIPLGITVILEGGTRNTRDTWLRMYLEQVITQSALRTIERSIVPGQAAFDDRRVLPGDQQDAHARPGTLSVEPIRARHVAGPAAVPDEAEAGAVLDTGAKFGERRSRKLCTPSPKSGAVKD